MHRAQVQTVLSASKQALSASKEALLASQNAYDEIEQIAAVIQLESGGGVSRTNLYNDSNSANRKKPQQGRSQSRGRKEGTGAKETPGAASDLENVVQTLGEAAPKPNSTPKPSRSCSSESSAARD